MRPSSRQTLFIWALLARGGEGASKDIKPELNRADRVALVQAGLLESHKGTRGALQLTLTDKGWDWANKNLRASLPANSRAGAAILQGWLTRLADYLDANKLSLAEVLSPQQEIKTPEATSDAATSLPDRVRAAYLRVTNGRVNRRVLLSDLRKELQDIDRASVDEALRQMHRDRTAILMRLDNPQEITSAVRNAEIQLSGEPVHILWIKE